MTLDVPALRTLRELPAAEDAEPTRSGWSFRSGLLSLTLVIGLLLTAVAGALLRLEPAPPAEFDPIAYQDTMDQGVDELTPAQGLELWWIRYEPLSAVGFAEFKTPRDREVETQIGRLRVYRKVALYAAGGVVLVGVLGFVALPR